MKLANIGFLVLMGLALAACGGGNDDGGGGSGDNGAGGSGGGGSGNSGDSGGVTNPPPPVATGAGFYSGSVSSGPQKFAAIETAIFDDGSYYVRYHEPTLAGFVTGKGEFKNGSFTSTDAHDYHEGGITTGTVSASYIAKNSLKGMITYDAPAQVAAFFAEYDAAYETRPLLTGLAGSYSGSMLTPQVQQTFKLSIDPMGVIAGQTRDGTGEPNLPILCKLTGSANAKAIGNAFDTRITFGGGSTCNYDGQTLFGIAILTGQSMVLMTTSADKTRGALLISIRDAK